MLQSSIDPLKVIQDKIDRVNEAINWNDKRWKVHSDMWSPRWPAIGFILYQYCIYYLTGITLVGVSCHGSVLIFGIAILAPYFDTKEPFDELALILHSFSLIGAFSCSLIYSLIYIEYSGWIRTIYLGTFLLQLGIAGSVICYRWFQDRMLKKELKRLVQEKEERIMWINFLRENKEKK